MFSVFPLVETRDYTFLLNDSFETPPTLRGLKVVDALSPLIILDDLRGFHFGTQCSAFYSCLISARYACFENI